MPILRITQPVPGRRLMMILLVWLWPVWGLPGAARAQSAPETTAVPERTPQLPEGTGEIRYLPTESGRLVPVPANATFEDYLKYVADRERRKNPAEARFSILSIALTGTADDEWARLKATIRIHVNDDDSYVKVPLMLGEATLAGIKYVGKGEQSPVNSDPKNNGYSWWFKGAGDHELQLDLIVRLRRQQLLSRRLVLSLPPRTGSRKLYFTVGMPRAKFTFPEDAAPLPDEKTGPKPGPDQSRIALSLGQNSLDVTWQPAPEQQAVKTLLQCETQIAVSFPPEAVRITADQRVEARQGSFQELTVRLPATFERRNIQLTGAALEMLEPIVGRENWYRLLLQEPTSGPVQIEWILERPIPEPGEPFRIEGFELENESLQQSGDITLSQAAGYRLDVTRDENGPSLSRRDLTPSETTPERRIQRAYQFYRQPFALVVDMQKIEPSYSVEPSVVLRFSRETVSLEAVYRILVHRGSLDSLTVDWIDRNTSGWRVEPPSDDYVASIDASADDPTRYIARFDQPLESKQFTFTFRATKLISEILEPLPIRLPRLAEGRFTRGVQVAIEGHLNLEVQMTSTPPPRLTLPPEQQPSNGYKTVGRYDFDGTRPIDLSVTVTPREGTVETSSTLTVGRGEEQNEYRTSQSITYDVEFEEIDTLRFRAPADAVAQLRIVDDKMIPLDAVPTGSSLGTMQQFRVALPEPRQGRFSVSISSRWMRDASRDSSAQSGPPLVQSVDADFSSTRLVLADGIAYELIPAESGWARDEPAPAELTAFDFRGKSLPVRIALKALQTGPRGTAWTIRKSLLESYVELDGTVETRCRYAIEGLAPSLEVELPEGFAAYGAALNGIEQNLPESASDGGVLTIPVGHEIRPVSTLELRLKSVTPKRLAWWSQVRFQAPLIRQSRNDGTSLWLTELPYWQHLFTLPDNFLPQFEWQRSDLFWRRQPNPDAGQLAAWIGSDSSAADAPVETHGNQYLFVCHGDPPELTYGTMSRAMVILIGAGLALVVSFLLLKLPAARNALTILALGLTVAVCAALSPASVSLLLQPAVLGILLAVVATLFDHYFRKSTSPTIITLDDLASNESGYGSSVASQTRDFQPALGSEEPTEVRHKSESVHESLSSSLQAGRE